MGAPARHALRAATNQAYALTASSQGSRRINYLRRTIHTSPARRRDEEPSNLPSAVWAHFVEPSPGGDDANQPSPQKLANAPDDTPEKPSKPKDPNNYGSASRRAGRNIKKLKEIPQVSIPQWFVDRNIILAENHSPASIEAAQESSSSVPDEGTVNESLREPDKQRLNRGLSINDDVNAEIQALISSAVQIQEQLYGTESSPPTKPHIGLHCPQEGGSAFLESYVADLASRKNLDLLRVTAQDIAEIGGAYMEESLSFRAPNLSSIGYDVAAIDSTGQRASASDMGEQEEADEMDEEDGEEESSAAVRPFSTRQRGIGMNVGIIPAYVGSFKLDDIFKTLQKPTATATESPGQPSNSPNGKSVVQLRDGTPDLKISMMVETLLNAPEIKRTLGSSEAAQVLLGDRRSTVQSNEAISTQAFPAQRGPNGLVLLLEDYPQINMTPNGEKFLDKLHEVVEARRKEGQPVVIIGTASSEKMLPSGNNKAMVNNVQSHGWDETMRTVIVPVQAESEGILEAEQKRRTRSRNLRHLRDMLRRVASSPSQVQAISDDWEIPIESKYAFVSGLESSAWSMDKVNRIATIALGLLPPSEAMTPKILEQAFGLIDSSDYSKYESVKQAKEAKSDSDSKTVLGERIREDTEERMRRLRKKCNAHEKKLLNGVVDAKNIRTTFADVQAPPETIEALKTLTSLSLVRPDAFTYGVLATDRIPGLLLYGPPGTGKTLLAKAVAKESGATVLEVSGSDVYDMYVGEGEKNIRAIFTLAKKLSPCVVFIDEADAILGSRSSGQSRASHRELINQFLREWDGMTDRSAFIMVATNRPFDLDEASLRRLPRRLLVDLPVEKDREAILKIHLKDEALDSAVSIAELASQTPFYSGSDLKNLCVAAALTCVREEFDTAVAHNRDSPDNPYQYANKRTLQPRHFTQAMSEISASISEDMGSLSAIRKFDEKYGDRKGRRKKLGGYGFKTVKDSEKLGSDAARVRNRS